MRKKRVVAAGVLMLVCLLAIVVNGRAGRAASWKVDKWNMKLSCEVTKGGYRFHAHISKDKEEAWIYLVETTSKAAGESWERPEKNEKSKSEHLPSALHFPKKIQNAKVTKIGADMTDTPRDELDFYQSVFGVWVEYAHGVDGYCNAVKNVKTLTIPNTVKEIDECAFSGMRELKKVEIPDSVSRLNGETFYGCEKLRELKLPKNLTHISSSCFDECPQLKNVTIPKSSPQFVIQNGALLSKNRKRLVWVPSGRKAMVVPNTVTTIESEAFYNSQVERIHLGKNITSLKKGCLQSRQLKDITVEKSNPVFARDGQCIYHRSDGRLVVGIAKMKKLVISGKVKKLLKDVSLCGELSEDERLDVLDVSASVEEMHSYCPALNVSTRVYYRRKNPPKVIRGDSSYAALPIFCEVYVPKSSLSAYKNWYKSMGCLSDIEKQDWHTF